jgi:hypothetical protein
MFNLFSRFRRSGENPFTADPSGPEFPPAGVTPLLPAKYGTFAARWLYSHLNVMNCLTHLLNSAVLPRTRMQATQQQSTFSWQFSEQSGEY